LAHAVWSARTRFVRKSDLCRCYFDRIVWLGCVLLISLLDIILR
jgi:hypothetical protein